MTSTALPEWVEVEDIHPTDTHCSLCDTTIGPSYWNATLNETRCMRHFSELVENAPIDFGKLVGGVHHTYTKAIRCRACNKQSTQAVVYGAISLCVACDSKHHRKK